jgi:hypothetical protein
MRSILIAVVAAAGIGLLGTSGAVAAPSAGAAIGDAAQALQPTVNVYCRRWYQCRHYTYTSYRRCGWWRRCGYGY